MSMDGASFKECFIDALKDHKGAADMRSVMKPLLEENTHNIASLFGLVKTQQAQISALGLDILNLQQQGRNNPTAISGTEENDRLILNRQPLNYARNWKWIYTW